MPTATAPPDIGVPLTSIITANDGIIDPDAGRHPDATVMTADASHSGILADATTYRRIATELVGLTGAQNTQTPESSQGIRVGRAEA